MKYWGIKTKVILLTLIPTLGVALVISALFAYSQLKQINQALLDHGSHTARHLASAAGFGIQTGDTYQLESLVRTSLEEQDIRSVTIYDRDQYVLVHAGPKVQEPFTIPAGLASHLTTYSSANVLRFSMPIYQHTQEPVENTGKDPALQPPAAMETSRLLGWSVVEVSRVATELAKYRTLFLAIVTVLGAAIVCTLLALRLSSDLTRPLVQLGGALGRIRDGKLNTRVYIEASPELMELQEGINSMAESLSKARKEMQLNIDQATEDLRETLETIEIQNIELDLARKEALEASRVKSEFLANMSHEIRTPLNGILGFAKLLSKSTLGLQQRDQLNTILKSSEILLTVINDILDFSKIEAGKLTLDNMPFNIRETVEDVLTMLAPGGHEKNLDLAGLVYSDVPEYIMGDPLRLKQIITNLVNNGIKFTQSGEVVVRVMLEEEEEESCVVKITVTDSGVGLSRNQQQNLFNAFSQADASTARRFGGTGLGLVISRRLTEQMGGKIGLESELGKGSTFYVELPVKIATAHPTPDYLPPALEGENLIYLETQAMTGLALSHTFNHWGANLTRPEGIRELVSEVEKAQEEGRGYALAIIGITRHQLRSTSYLQAVRKLEYQLDCRTLILTPTLEHGSDEPPLLEEASNFLIKPTSQRRLATAVTQLIRGALPAPQLNSERTKDKGLQSLRKPNILAVDDNTANLKLVEAFLLELGAVVDTALSGYEALTKVKLGRFDIIFMDVQMPGMDGVETTQKIRKFEKDRRHTPIIALTAHALANERRHLISSGFDDYLTKPTNEEELQRVIARYTGLHLETTGVTKEPQPQKVVSASTIKPSVRQARERCVDIESSVQLAGNKIGLAIELFSMLLDSLPEDKRTIDLAFQDQQDERLLEAVHRLHGATRYCGVPLLRQAAAELESALKRKDAAIDDLVNNLSSQIDQVLYWAERNDWQADFNAFEREFEG